PMFLQAAVLVAAATGTWPSIDQPLRSGEMAGADAAVVIGLEDYAFVSDVPYAKRDASAVYNHLVYNRGIPARKVQQLLAGNREQMLDAVERGADQVGEGGTLWIYYSGHGAASPVDGQRIWLGDDVKADEKVFANRSVAVDEVETIAGNSTAQRVILLMDTCYGGLGRAGDQLLPGKRFTVPDYALSPSKSEIVAWSASGSNELSEPLEEAQHGMFTYLAIGALRGWADGEISGTADGAVSLGEAHQYTRRILQELGELEQTPTLRATDEANNWIVGTTALENPPDLLPRVPTLTRLDHRSKAHRLSFNRVRPSGIGWGISSMAIGAMTLATGVGSLASNDADSRIPLAVTSAFIGIGGAPLIAEYHRRLGRRNMAVKATTFRHVAWACYGLSLTGAATMGIIMAPLEVDVSTLAVTGALTVTMSTLGSVFMGIDAFNTHVRIRASVGPGSIEVRGHF
ncbi:MAG: hypothetical protein HN348_02755, partial [Proteobacteria bacterium]|nr:hypothetical protein [Pseudomonadota bacterium]